MKKMTTILVALLLVLSMAACGKNASENDEKGEEKVWKVAVLLPYIGDQSYLDAVENARKEIDGYDNVEATLIEMGLDYSLWESFFTDACESDYDLIVGGFADVEPYLYDAAEKYPDQLFFNYDFSSPEDLDNVFAVNYSLSDLGYIAGYLSSRITTSDMEKANPDKKVGVIVGEDSEYMNDFIGSYCEVCTEMGVQVYISYTNSFTDPAKGKEQALSMYNEGVDIIWQVAGGTGLGVFEAAAEKGRYALGVDADQTIALEGQPHLAETIVTSMEKDCGQALIYAVEKLIAGEYPAGTKMKLGIEQGTIGVVENEQYLSMVPEDIRKDTQEIMDKIENGEIHAYSVAEEPDRWEEVKAAATAQ